MVKRRYAYAVKLATACPVRKHARAASAAVRPRVIDRRYGHMVKLMSACPVWKDAARRAQP